MKLVITLILLSLSSCGYNWGHSKRELPEGHKSVFVRQFDNSSREPGIETLFTNALIRELERSGFVIVASRDAAELILRGTIVSVSYTGSASTRINGRSLFSNYVVNLTANVEAVRSRDDKLVWQTTISGTDRYLAPTLTQPGLRSSNPVYNQSAREMTIKTIAQQMMNDAFDQLTETF